MIVTRGLGKNSVGLVTSGLGRYVEVLSQQVMYAFKILKSDRVFKVMRLQVT